MSFDSLAYLIFLPVVYLLYRVLPHVGQNWLLLVASYIFYGAWDPRFLLLILAGTAFDFFAALIVDRGRLEAGPVLRMGGLCAVGGVACLAAAAQSRGLLAIAEPAGGWPTVFAIAAAILAVLYLGYLWLLRVEPTARRRLALVSTMVSNLTLLGFFKYYNFFVGSAEGVFRAIGMDPTSLRLDIVLPVGISFYTFQTMSYTIDVYRRKLAATDRVVNFALFISYFPQLVAGPIERATHLLPSIEKPRHVNWEQSFQGLYLLLLGAFKKVAIADGVAGTVNSVYDAKGAVSCLDVALATALFAVQIYCDFSGYSDMARGSSKLFGIELMRNFRSPYVATNPSDFWQRWHISLSTWLRDYLYIPLGGSRGSKASTYRNLMLTMVIGGLWHGAAWNFVLWGLFHGSILCLHRALVGERKRSTSVAWHYLSMAGFFVVTCYGWLLFRASSFEQVCQFTAALFVGFGDLGSLLAKPTLAAIAGLPVLVLIEIVDDRAGLVHAHRRASPVARGLVCSYLLFVTFMGLSNAPQQFIYFQF